MNSDFRQRRLFLIAISVIGVLILDRFVLTPAIDYWQQSNIEIATLRQDLVAGGGTLALTDRARDRWVELKNSALPKDVAQSEQILLSHLNEWGDQVGATISSIKPQWKRGADRSFSTLVCRIDAIGSLTSISRFLHAVESSPLALRLDSVELVTRDERGQQIAAALVVSGLRLQPLDPRL